MKDLLSIRYIGYTSLPEGGRSLDFSYGLGGDAKNVAVEVPLSFLEGPQRISIQETSSICYETLKARLQSETSGTPFGESPQEKIGTIQRRLAWPLRKDDTHKSRKYHFFLYLINPI